MFEAKVVPKEAVFRACPDCCPFVCGMFPVTIAVLIACPFTHTEPTMTAFPSTVIVFTGENPEFPTTPDPGVIAAPGRVVARQVGHGIYTALGAVNSAELAPVHDEVNTVYFLISLFGHSMFSEANKQA